MVGGLCHARSLPGTAVPFPDAEQRCPSAIPSRVAISAGAGVVASVRLSRSPCRRRAFMPWRNGDPLGCSRADDRTTLTRSRGSATYFRQPWTQDCSVLKGLWASPSINRSACRQGWTRANRPAIRPMANHTDTHAPADVWPRMWAGASCCAETGLRLIHVCSVSTNQALAAALRPVERGFAWLKSWRIFCRSRRSPQPHGVTHQELPSGWWQALSKNDR